MKELFRMEDLVNIESEYDQHMKELAEVDNESYDEIDALIEYSSVDVH